MKVLMLTRYDNLGASSRLRSLQYLPFLREKGLDITVSYLLNNDYLLRLYAKQKTNYIDVIKSYLNRIAILLQAKQYDVLWIEKELFPWLPFIDMFLLKVIKKPYIVDFDDAVFHNYDLHNKGFIRKILGSKIATIMRYAALVTAGNDYLAAHAEKAGAKHIYILPTVIDINRYKISQPVTKSIFNIGWIGTPATQKYLQIVEPALQQICNDEQTRFSTIGLKNYKIVNVNMVNIPWSETAETQHIAEFDVGIMPLIDSPWEKGKCGYKLIQYMACAKPVIASPVGVNTVIVQPGENGLLASTTDEWIQALTKLRNDAELCQHMGLQGRQLVEQRYCIQAVIEGLYNAFSSIKR